MEFVRIRDIVLHYRREGREGGLPLVFINSLGTDMRIWDAVVPAFAADYNILRYDKRGHGLSDSPLAPYTLSDHTNDLDDLLNHLEIETAALVGVSVGGNIALDFASQYPGRVKALVVCDSQPRIGTAEMWNTRIFMLQQHGMTHLADTILGRWFAPSFQQQHPAVYQGYRNMFIRMPVEGYIGTCAALRDMDLTEQMSMMRARTLVLCGAEDTATPPEQVKEMAGTLPDGQMRVIEEAGHLPCVEQPQTTAAYIRDFLEEIGYV